MSRFAVSMACVAVLLVVSISSPVLGCWGEGYVFFPNWADDCPKLTSHSSCSGYRGGLVLDYEARGIQGAPGSPFDLVFHYDSSADDPGTFGTHMNIEVRAQAVTNPSENPLKIIQGLVEIDVNQDNAIDMCSEWIAFEYNLLCSNYMSGVTVPSGNSLLPHHTAPAYACSSGSTNIDGVPLWSVGYSVPVILDGSQEPNRPRPPACPDCEPLGMMFEEGGGLYRLQARVVLEKDAWPGNFGIFDSCDLNEPDKGMLNNWLYLEAHAPEDVSWMGRNWSHSYSDHIVKPAQAPPFPFSQYPKEYVVLRTYTGARHIFYGWKEDEFTGTIEEGTANQLVAVPDEQGVASAWQLWATQRGYEQFYRDGSRRVFDKDSGRLVRIEERNGKNSLTLEWPETYPDSGVYQLTRVTDPAGHWYDFEYYTNGLLKKVKLPGQRVWSLEYDGQGRLKRLKDPEAQLGYTGGPWTFHYFPWSVTDARHNHDITWVEHPDGTDAVYTYYPSDDAVRPGRLRTSTLGGTSKYKYVYTDPTLSQRTVSVFPVDAVSEEPITTLPGYKVTFDSHGRMVESEVIGAECHLTGQQSPPCASDVITEVRRNLQGLPLVIETKHRPVEFIPPPSPPRKQCYEWDPEGNLLEIRGPFCYTEGMECEGNPSNCPGDRYTWAPWSQPPNYAPYWRVTEIRPWTEAWGNQLKYRLDYTAPEEGNGNIKAGWQPLDVPGTDLPTTLTWSWPTPDICRLQALTDGSGQTWTFEYTADHLLWKETDPEGYVTERTYDPSGTGFVTEVIAPGLVTTKVARNQRGQERFITLPNDHAAGEPSIENRYDNGGRLTEVRDLHRCTAWRYTFDPVMGYVTAVDRMQYALTDPPDPQDPCTDTVTHTQRYSGMTYNSHGQLLTSTNRAQQVTTYGFGPYGDLLFRDLDPAVPGSPDECYWTDPLEPGPRGIQFNRGSSGGECSDFPPGQNPLLPADVERFEYDLAGRLALEDVQLGCDATRHKYYVYPYARYFETASLVPCDDPAHPVPLSDRTLYFDANGRLEDQQDQAYRGGFPFLIEHNFGYDPSQRLQSVETPVGSALSLVTLDYYHNGQPKEYYYTDDICSLEGHLQTLTYDPAGRLWQFDAEQQFGRRQRTSYWATYDKNGQVKTWDKWYFGPPANEELANLEYFYDESWNLTAIVDHLHGGGKYFPAIDWEDRIGAPSPYSYDENGNLTSDGLQCYEYDSENRLVDVKLVAGSCAQSGSVIATYAYDPMGRMLYRDMAGTRTRFLYNGWTLEHELLDGATQAGKSYSWAGTGGVALGHFDSGGSYVPYAWDAQGSPKNSALLDNPAYDPFGNLISGSPVSPSLGFQGQQRHDEVGLYYMRNRWYHPAIGRFMSVDPIISSTVNNYNFVLNNPLMSSDPLGLLPPGALVCGSVYPDTAQCTHVFVVLEDPTPEDDWDYAGLEVRSFGCPPGKVGCKAMDLVAGSEEDPYPGLKITAWKPGNIDEMNRNWPLWKAPTEQGGMGNPGWNEKTPKGKTYECYHFVNYLVNGKPGSHNTAWWYTHMPNRPPGSTSSPPKDTPESK